MSKIYNPSTDRYIKDTKPNRKKIETIAKQELFNIASVENKKDEKTMIDNFWDTFIRPSLIEAKIENIKKEKSLLFKTKQANQDLLIKRKRRELAKTIGKENVTLKNVTPPTNQYTGLRKKKKVDLALARNAINKQITLDAYEFIRMNTTEHFNKTVSISTYRSKRPIQLHEENINRIVKQIKTFFIVEKKINYSISVRLYFSNEDNSFHKNIVISKTDYEMNQIAPKLFNLLQRLTVLGYNIFLRQIDVMFIKFKNRGGCDDREHITKVKSKKDFYFKTTMKTKDNNCGIMVFIKFLSIHEIDKTRYIPKSIKKQLFPKEKADYMLSYEDLVKVGEFFRVNFVCYNQEKEELIKYTCEDAKNKDNVLEIMLYNEHYEILTEVVQLKQCPDCFDRYEKIHNCNKDRVSYNRNVLLKKQDVVSTVVKQFDEVEDLSNVLIYDFETLEGEQGKQKKLKVYCVGYKFIGGEYKYIWGEDSIKLFVDMLLSLEKPTILSAYNGSKFDLYYIIEELNKRKYEIKQGDYMQSNGAIIVLKFGNCCVFDLCKFLMCSLDKACKDFKVKNAKTTFNHKLMTGFDVIDKYKDECLEYLKMDVLALEELSKVMSMTFYNKYKVHLHKYITASQLAYDIWRHSNKECDYNIFIVKEQTDYDFIRSSIIGGRTYPLQKYFQTALWEEVEKNKNDKEKLAMLYKRIIETNDFIYNCDVVSLYPTAMMNKFPIGQHRKSNNPEEDFLKGLYGIYEIDYIANKSVIVSPFIKKSDEGRALWCVEDGSGVYNNIDIQNAISLGYKITFRNKAIVWDKTDYVMKNFIQDVYAWKKSCKEKNAEYQLSKLILNSLYGKFLQRSCNDTTEFAHSLEDLCRFLKYNYLEDFSTIGDSLLLTGIAKDTERRITKPCHLGSFVLGYSRQIMYSYMKCITKDLSKHPFTYTDTDSLHVKGKHFMEFKKRNLFGSELGMLSNDCDGDKDDDKYTYNIGPVIIKECNLAPKLYCYWSLTASGTLKVTNKAKGIPKKLLDEHMFVEEKKKVVEFESLKKIHRKVCNPDKKDGFNEFSIKSVKNTRTFLNSIWEGMNYADNGKYYPKGYEAKVKLSCNIL